MINCVGYNNTIAQYISKQALYVIENKENLRYNKYNIKEVIKSAWAMHRR